MAGLIANLFDFWIRKNNSAQRAK